jgi:hypothetical protein
LSRILKTWCFLKTTRQAAAWCLTASGNLACIAPMKTKFLAVVGALAIVAVAAGCYSKVSGGSRMGMPFVKDRVAGNYERPLGEVYAAAIQVVNFNGAVVKESTDFGQTNVVKTIVGRVMERNVYVSVESVDPKVTAIVVQARTSGGGTDMALAHELEKQVALKLAR